MGYRLFACFPSTICDIGLFYRCSLVVILGRLSLAFAQRLLHGHARPCILHGGCRTFDGFGFFGSLFGFPWFLPCSARDELHVSFGLVWVGWSYFDEPPFQFISCGFLQRIKAISNCVCCTRVRDRWRCYWVFFVSCFYVCPFFMVGVVLASFHLLRFSLLVGCS